MYGYACPKVYLSGNKMEEEIEKPEISLSVRLPEVHGEASD